MCRHDAAGRSRWCIAARSDVPGVAPSRCRRAMLEWAKRGAARCASARSASRRRPRDGHGAGRGERGSAAVPRRSATSRSAILRHAPPLDEPISHASARGTRGSTGRRGHHRPIWDANEEAFQDHWEPRSPIEGTSSHFRRSGHRSVAVAGRLGRRRGRRPRASTAIYADENEQTGEQVGWLDSVATRRPWRRRGLAGALIARSLQVLRDRGMESAALGVDAENPTGALQVYERLGFQRRSRCAFSARPF